MVQAPRAGDEITAQLRPWQLRAIELIEQFPNEGLCIVAPRGECGKTMLANYLVNRFQGTYLMDNTGGDTVFTNAGQVIMITDICNLDQLRRFPCHKNWRICRISDTCGLTNESQAQYIPTPWYRKDVLTDVTQGVQSLSL